MSTTREGQNGGKKTRHRHLLDEPPDGGWGWMIVLATFVVQFIVRGVQNSAGIYFAVLVDYFQEGAGMTSWISSCLTSLSLLTGPFAAALSKRYTHRKVAFTGGLLASVSMAISTFAPNVNYIIVTFGILTAIMGLYRGTFAAVNAPALKEITGQSKFTSGYGLAVPFIGMFQLIGPVVAGYLYDYTHNYDVSFYVGGASTMLAGIIVLSTHFVLERWQLIHGNESSENMKDFENGGGKNVLLGQSPHNDRVGEDSEETDIESLDLECVSVTYVERETTIKIELFPRMNKATGERKKSYKHTKQTVVLLEPPDGGWGWMIVLAAFIILFIVRGIQNSVGLFFAVLVEYFQEGAGTTSWITSCLTSISLCTGPFSAALSKRYTHRKVVFAGGLLAAVSMVISSFATNVKYIIVTFGVFTGIGFGLARVPAVAMLARYFRRRHASANGLVVVGTGGGSFVMAPLIRLLIDVYGWQGTLIVIGGISLNILVCATLLRPIELKGDNERSNIGRNSENSESHDNVPISENCKTTDRFDNHKPMSKCSRFVAIINEYFELSLFKNLHFASIMIAYIFFGFGQNIPLVHIVKRATNVGISDTESPLLLSVLGLSIMIGGFAQGLVVDFLHFTQRKVFGAAFILYGIFTSLLVTTHTFVTTAVVMTLLGLCRGTFAALNAPVVREITGQSKFTSGYGLSLFVIGTSQLMGPVIAGYLYDYTHNYNASFFVGGVSSILGGVITVGAYLVLERRSPIEGSQPGYNDSESAMTDREVEKLQVSHSDVIVSKEDSEDLEFPERMSVMYIGKETSI
ncbi:monocarboxylate transporter 9-like [Glandiceps talaboti]